LAKAFTPHHDGHFTAGAIQVRLDHLQHHAASHRRIEGIAAALQHPHGGLGGQPVRGRSHAKGAADLGPGGEHGESFQSWGSIQFRSAPTTSAAISAAPSLDPAHDRAIKVGLALSHGETSAGLGIAKCAFNKGLTLVNQGKSKSFPGNPPIWSNHLCLKIICNLCDPIEQNQSCRCG
jgi:hypothetical protein